MSYTTVNRADYRIFSRFAWNYTIDHVLTFWNRDRHLHYTFDEEPVLRIAWVLLPYAAQMERHIIANMNNYRSSVSVNGPVNHECPLLGHYVDRYVLRYVWWTNLSRQYVKLVVEHARPNQYNQQNSCRSDPRPTNSSRLLSHRE